MEISSAQTDELRDALDAVYQAGTGWVDNLEQNTKGVDTVIFGLRYHYHPLANAATETHAKDDTARTRGSDQARHVDLIMRIYARDGTRDALQRAHWEFAVLESLHASSLSVPKPICLVDSEHGAPYLVMERVLGRSMGEYLLEQGVGVGREDETTRVVLQFVSKMVQIHEIPPESLQIPGRSEELEVLRRDPKQAITRMLDWPRDTIERYDIAELRPVLKWLDETLEKLPDVSISWVHGDFHPENILINPLGELVVIDWSNIRLVDRRVDIAFAICVMNAYGEGLDLSERLTGLYQQISGRTVSHIDFFLLLSSFHNILRMYSMVNDFRITGENESTRQVMLGDYVTYGRVLLKVVKDVTGQSVPSVEAVVRGRTG